MKIDTKATGPPKIDFPTKNRIDITGFIAYPDATSQQRWKNVKVLDLRLCA